MKRRQFILSSIFCGSVVSLTQTLGSASPVIHPKSIVSIPPKEPFFRFVALADTGTGESGQYAVAEALTRYHQEKPFHLAILGGDNIYPNGEMERIQAVFEKPYQILLEKGVKFQACLGNHDIRTANGDLQLDYPGFNMQGRYYTFRQEPIQFFALDTNRNADFSTQWIWLEEQLKRSDAPWKVVFAHHPVYSSGIHGGNKQLRERLTPLFQKYGVQLYINGHDHNYERTRSIQRTTYLTCGAGSMNRFVRRSAWTESSTPDLSFAAFEVYDHQIVVQGINTKNQVFDQGIIPR